MKATATEKATEKASCKLKEEHFHHEKGTHFAIERIFFIWEHQHGCREVI